MSDEARAATATALALVALGLGFGALNSRFVGPLQCDRETPQRWVHQGPVMWPIKNGMALGFGAGTRLGFPLWYAIPAGALLSGSIPIGAALYGTYGVIRTGAAGLIWLKAKRIGDFDPVLEWVLNQNERARLLTASHLMLLGGSTFVIVGL